MNRRDNLKLLFTGSLGSSLIWTACDPAEKVALPSPVIQGTPGGRIAEEIALDNRLLSEKFFTEEEMKLLAELVDIIVPKDAVSGSATDAKVPDFIEFMAKDKPETQTPLRGGMMWLNNLALEKHSKSFVELAAGEKMELIDLIAWPDKAGVDMQGGVKFFNLLRNLTLSGFYTTEIGFKDIGYVGNTPNVWDGVPADVMEQYGLSLDEKYLDVYLKTETRGDLAAWDEEGKLIS